MNSIKLCIYSFSDFSHHRISPFLDRVVLFFGSIYLYKNVPLVLRAAGELEKEGIRFVIAGENRMDLVVDHSLGNVDYQLRFVTYEELGNLFRQCRTVILPYSSATQAGPVLNAFYYEKPVIASRLANLAGYVEHEKTGLLFEIGNFLELRDSIQKMCADDAFYLSLVQNIKMAKTEGKFSINNQTQKLQSIFEN